MARPRVQDLLAFMAHSPNVWTDVTGHVRQPQLAQYLTIAGDCGFLDRIFWGTDYVGTDTTVYLARVCEGVDFMRNGLNPILKVCGCPTLAAEQIDGFLGENIRRFLNL